MCGCRVLGVGHPHAHHAHGHLHHLVRVRVVHEGSGAPRLEFVDIGLAHGNGALGQAAHTVHAAGQALAVPVDGGVLGQLVGHEETQAITLDHLDGGARALAVVAPHVHLEARRHLAHHGLGHQVEFLDAVVHAPGQGPPVERDHRVVGPSGGRDEGRRGGDRGLDDGLGQARQRGAGHGQAGHGCSGACKKLSPGVGVGHALRPFNARLPGPVHRRPPARRSCRARHPAAPTEDRPRRSRNRAARRSPRPWPVTAGEPRPEGPRRS